MPICRACAPLINIHPQTVLETEAAGLVRIGPVSFCVGLLLHVLETCAVCIEVCAWPHAILVMASTQEGMRLKLSPVHVQSPMS